LWIYGYRFGPHYYVPSILHCPAYNVHFKPIFLLVDTGATTTTLFAEKIGLSQQTYENLPLSTEVITLGGTKIYRRIRQDVHLIFTTTFPEKLHTITLKGCDVIRLGEIGIEEPLYDGVLGMDVINRFKSWFATGKFIVFQT